MRASRAVGVLLVVAGAGAAAGWMVERGSTAAIDGAAREVVAIRVDFGGGRSETASGLSVSPSGQIAVAYSSVNGAESIEVRIPGGASTLPASVAGLDPTDDVALLQLQDAPPLPAARLANVPAPQVGDQITAIGGSAWGSGATVLTAGRVTATGGSLTAVDSISRTVSSLKGAIRFSGTLPVSDAGGALVSGSGQLLGMIVAISAQLRPPAAPAEGVALPIVRVAAIAAAVASGKPDADVLSGPRTVLGVDAGDDTQPAGALVEAVEFVSPAQAAGIIPGDVITAVGGSPVLSAAGLALLLQAHRPGQRVEVDWLTSSGQRRHTLVTLASGVAS